MDPSLARIIDANANRAREALRVIEEYARFVLEDAGGSEQIKQARHALAAALGRFPAGELLAARDTPGDVGTAISTASERQRGGAADVLAANCKRLTEALRAIEEYAKAADPGVAAEVEALRYRAYDIEQRLILRGDRAGRFGRTRLYVLITAGLCAGEWLATAEAAMDGGADCLQLREKGLDDGELLARARAFVELCRSRGVLCIINDRPDIARLADADGVHLGQTDMRPADARRIVGADRLIGVSTHTPEQLTAAIAQAPDYIAVGPMFETATKPQDHVAGAALLAEATARTAIPIVPIGGVTAERVGILRASGARRVCVCAAVIAGPDPRAAADRLRALLDEPA